MSSILKKPEQYSGKRAFGTIFPMSPATLHIDLDAIAHNTALLKRGAGAAKLMCVVKANAYNHGVERVVPVMDKAGADAFGVATLAEAAQVKRLTDKPVLAWMWAPGEPIPAGIEVGVPTLTHLRTLIDVSPHTPVHLMLDTGMNRSGIDEEDWADAFAIATNAGLTVRGVMSHLACADEPGNPFNTEQYESFQRGIALARSMGLDVPCNHLANSPGTLSRKELAFEQVRAGVALYGLDPVAPETGPEAAPGTAPNTDFDRAQLRPAMTWSAEIVAVKRIGKGEGASYGLTWTAPEDGYTAVVPVGYADGLPRAWQDAVEVTVNGARYPQVGRVCMDQFIVWLGDNPANVQPGDAAVIFGEGGMTAAELADRAGTIHYEVVCSPCGRVERQYSHETSL